jgi:dTDP-D-glucose 4,6-dehydratase
VELAESLLGYRPSTTIEEGLARTVAWFDANWEAIRDSAKFRTLTAVGA